jgi:hypothetical protein
MDRWTATAQERVHCAGELDQNAIAGQLDDATVMLGDCGINQLFAKGVT